MQIQQDKLIFVELAEIEALFTEISREYVKPSALSMSSMDREVAPSSSISNMRTRLSSKR
jgi:hypothetical protein